MKKLIQIEIDKKQSRKRLFMDINPAKLSEQIDNLKKDQVELKNAGNIILNMINRQKFLDEMKIPVDMTYNIYIPSKLNSVRCILPKCLNNANVKFTLVVEPQDVDNYSKKWGAENLLILPKNNMGLCYSRNFIIKHSRSIGERKHWQLDDDVGGFTFVGKDGISTSVNPSRALSYIEQQCEKFINIGIAGPSNQAFKPQVKSEVFNVNKLVASCLLIDNSCDHVNFEIDCVDDIDCCLNILSSHHWCTLKFINVLMGKANDLQVSGNYNAMDKYNSAVKILMKKWPGSFSTNSFGRLKASRIWNNFKQTPITSQNDTNQQKRTLFTKIKK